MQNFYIISGGPGSGKTSIINGLAKQGIPCMPEAGRAIIQDQIAIGGPALPWADKSAFAELMLCWEMRSYRQAQQWQGPVLFDRGIPDVMGYLLLNNLPVPAHIEKAAQSFQYNLQVFLAPPWPDIYTTDNERKQSELEATATYNMMVTVYSKLGYTINLLPLTTVEERVQFLIKTIRN
ncbi:MULTISPECIES: AAA family ATPase [Niastella]|uniref:AAA family ATPase n=1 Tax=Niastella soli TaxID=2821487 RepID=A0ABS3YZ56_9BACT|nr:AAA family ATPase [Niastella soli]MBO9203205.1 AAA family ATPase [Niastella soli]